MKKTKTIRTYVDTSVFGGIEDEEFCDVSLEFFKQVEMGYFSLVTSAVVKSEIEPAPMKIKKFFDKMLEFAEVVEITEDAQRLRNAYLEAKIVSPHSSDDALHVALATVSQCDLIVSWNFKHIVHFEKISLYNAVNVLNGFSHLSIFSPLEVLKYEE